VLLKVQELCDVPRCDDNLFLYIAIGCVASLMFIIALTSIYCFKRRLRGGKTSSSSPSGGVMGSLSSPSKFMSGNKQMMAGANPLEMNALLQNGTMNGNNTMLSSSSGSAGSEADGNKQLMKPIEIPLNNVRFLQELGEGAFGEWNQGAKTWFLNGVQLYIHFLSTIPHKPHM
jgi:receptor tyrosine kinase-like orphan receptor 1